MGLIKGIRDYWDVCYDCYSCRALKEATAKTILLILPIVGGLVLLNSLATEKNVSSKFDARRVFRGINGVFALLGLGLVLFLVTVIVEGILYVYRAVESDDVISWLGYLYRASAVSMGVSGCVG